MSVNKRTFKQQITLRVIFIKYNSLKSYKFFNAIFIPCFSESRIFRVRFQVLELVVIARCLVQCWQMFSSFLIFSLLLLLEVAKYEKLGKYIPYCTQLGWCDNSYLYYKLANCPISICTLLWTPKVNGHRFLK